MKVNLVNIETEKTSSEDLQDEYFGLDPRKDILHRVVTWQLSRKRLGTRKTKSRGEITGSTKKIMRQKGSGGARHRTKKVNLFRGGGTAFGPKVRDHSTKLPKKIRKLGLRHALSAKAKNNELIIVDGNKVIKFKGNYLKLSKQIIILISLISFFVASQGLSILYLFLLADLFCCAAVLSVFYGFYSKEFNEKNAYVSIIVGLVGGILFFSKSRLFKINFGWNNIANRLFAYIYLSILTILFFCCLQHFFPRSELTLKGSFLLYAAKAKQRPSNEYMAQPCRPQ